jgi:hypothetical protein
LFSTSTTTALQNTGISFSIGNSETWAFEFNIPLLNSNSTGCGFGILVSAGSPTVEAIVFGNGASLTAINSARITATNTSAGTIAATTNASSWAQVRGIVAATASGACTVSLGIQPGLSSTITARANAYVKALKST